MANFPASLDNGSSLPNPAAGNNTNNPSHAGLHTAENAAIIAAETKIGTGASTPASNTLLVGTGAGTSAWQGLTSAQLAAILSDETGSGAAVFANTPVLITPKVDTINENTVGNGVTVAGVNIKSGVIQGTPLASNAVPTAALQSGAVTYPKIGTDSSFAFSSYASTSTIVGWSAFTNKVIQYIQIGKFIFISYTIAGTSNSTSTSFTVPVAAKSINGGTAVCVDTTSGLVVDNGAVQSGPARVYIDPSVSTTLVTLVKGMNGTWTASGTKDVRGILWYEAA